MTNDITTTAGNSVATIVANRFLAHGNLYATTALGRLLKFQKGSYEADGKSVALGRHFVAHVNQAAHGFVKFSENGDKPEYRRGKIADGFEMPNRAELDCQDKTKWPLGRDGRPRDPWTPQIYLPLVAVDDENEIYTFVSASAGGFSAVGLLTYAFGKRGAEALPIVELGTEEYRHKNFGKIAKPRFTIIRWTDDAPPAEYPPFDVIHDEPPANPDDDLPF